MRVHLLACLAAATLLAGCHNSNDLSAGGKSAKQDDMSCEGYPRSNDDGTTTVCEAREHRDLQTSGTASITAEEGSIRGTAGEAATISLTAYVYATGASEEEAANTASQVQVHTENDEFFATGPERSETVKWGVSFDATLPAAMNLTARTTLGSVSLSGTNGRASLESGGGDITVNGLSGTASANTASGNVDVTFAGASWTGEGLTAATQNGSVTLNAPQNYSAQFELETTNGTIRSEFSGYENTSEEHQTHSETVGGGGVTLRAAGMNGDVSLKKLVDEGS